MGGSHVNTLTSFFSYHELSQVGHLTSSILHVLHYSSGYFWTVLYRDRCNTKPRNLHKGDYQLSGTSKTHIPAINRAIGKELNEFVKPLKASSFSESIYRSHYSRHNLLTTVLSCLLCPFLSSLISGGGGRKVLSTLSICACHILPSDHPSPYHRPFPVHK